MIHYDLHGLPADPAGPGQGRNVRAFSGVYSMELLVGMVCHPSPPAGTIRGPSLAQNNPK